VFPEADVPAFRERLAQLVTDPVLRETLAHAGRERVLSQFTQRHIALETARVYQGLLA